MDQWSVGSVEHYKAVLSVLVSETLQLGRKVIRHMLYMKIVWHIVQNIRFSKEFICLHKSVQQIELLNLS